MTGAYQADMDLLAAARDAAAHAYAPYSRFAVGAALRMADGSIIAAANVENASYGLTLCAETVAVAIAANRGALSDVVAVAVIGGARGTDGGISGDALLTPCGRCRQMLNEAAALGGRDLPVTCASWDASKVTVVALSTLLPHAFGPGNLGKEA